MIGHQLAALRRTREKTCPVCGTVFEAFAKQTYDTNSAPIGRATRAMRRRGGPRSVTSTAVSGRRVASGMTAVDATVIGRKAKKPADGEGSIRWSETKKL